MFESIRNHSRWVMAIFLCLIAVAFVLADFQRYQFGGATGEVAEVSGKPILESELERAQREQLEQLRRMLGANFDQQLFDTPQARAAVLDGLISERAVAAEAAKEHVNVTKKRLQETIAAVPAFQRDGKFDNQIYVDMLRDQGFTASGFEQRVLDDLQRQTLRQALTQSAIVPAAVADRLQRIVGEEREIRELRFRPEEFVAKVKLTEDTVRAYYNEKQKDFETPESVRVEYVVLTLDDVAAQIKVPDSELKAFYEQNQSRFGEAEQRRASHILIAAPEGASEETKNTARKKAEQLLPRAKSSAAEFAKLAREVSADPGSAEKGGDLNFLGRNMTVKPFEDALFALKPGEVSGVVQSEFGFHIIRLAEIRPARTAPFDQVRGEIEAELRRQAAQKQFAEREELFKNTAYEQPDSLKPVAEKLKLEIQTLDRLTRAGVPARPGTPQIFSAPVVQALFSEDSIQKKANIEAVEVGPNAWVAARVVEHRPATVRPFEEVQAAIRARLEREEAVKLARAAGEEKLANLRQTSNDTGFGAVRTVSRARAEGLPQTALTSVLRAPADKFPTYVGVEVDGGAYSVVKVMSSRVPDKALAEGRAATQRALEQQSGSGDEQAYVQALRIKHKARVLRDEFKPASTTSTETKDGKK